MSRALAPTLNLVEDGRPRPSHPGSVQSSSASEIFSRACQESSQNICYGFEQHPVFRAEAVLAIALHAQHSQLVRRQLNRNEYLGSGLRKHNFNWSITARAHRLLRRIFSDRQKDSGPGIVTASAQEIDHVVQRRMMRQRPAVREQAFDISQKLAGGTINFQGRVLEARKIDASVTADRGRVNGFGAAFSTWQLAISNAISNWQLANPLSIGNSCHGAKTKCQLLIAKCCFLYLFSNSLGLSGMGWDAEASGLQAVWLGPADGFTPKSHT